MNSNVWLSLYRSVHLSSQSPHTFSISLLTPCSLWINCSFNLSKSLSIFFFSLSDSFNLLWYSNSLSANYYSISCLIEYWSYIKCSRSYWYWWSWLVNLISTVESYYFNWFICSCCYLLVVSIWLMISVFWLRTSFNLSTWVCSIPFY